MSGIAGIFDEYHQITNQITIFEKMIQSMKHRGFYNSIYLDNHISLMQTCSSKSKEIVHVQHYYIIFDGKCFNIEEIKEHLIQKDITNFDNDLEVILNLYSIAS